jgi:hypothetical protein
VQVGQVTAIAADRDVDLAVALAERADRSQQWLGLGRRSPGPLALVLVRGGPAFDSIARGRVPSWGAGLAIPGARLVVVRADEDDPFRVLRHELAHLVLHQAVRGRVPLWFDEGYAALAAGEIDRFDALRLNLSVARGKVPSLDELNAGLRDAAATAEVSYALAASAVAFLARKHPTGTLDPLLAALARGVTFDTAVAITTGLTPGRLELAWRNDVKRRHNLGVWLIAGGMWGVIGGGFILAAVLRRRRDRPRREALDQGWIVESDPPEEGSGGGPGPADRPGL